MYVCIYVGDLKTGSRKGKERRIPMKGVEKKERDWGCGGGVWSVELVVDGLR